MPKEDLDNLNKKERKEYLKSLHSSKEGREKRTRLIVVAVIVLGIILAVAGLYFLAQAHSKESIPDVGTKVEPMAAPNTATHIDVGSQHVPYSTNPPTSGPHYNQTGWGPIECTIYSKEVKDESALHNMEHGAVWVTYKDINDKDLAAKLKETVADYAKVLVSPRAANDSKIALVAWGWILKLDKFDQAKIKNFILKHRNQAPESMAGCGSYPSYL